MIPEDRDEIQSVLEACLDRARRLMLIADQLYVFMRLYDRVNVM